MAWYDFVFPGLAGRIRRSEKARADMAVERIAERMASKYGAGQPAATLLPGNGRSGGAKWAGGLSNSGSTHFINHFETRQNARRAYHETPQARALVERYADTVVDVGLEADPTPMIDMLGIGIEDAERWASYVRARWSLWCQSKKQHRAETMTFYQAQRQYQVYQQRDNDVYMRLYYSMDTGLINPLQFSFIDPNQIRGGAWTSTYLQPGGDDGIIRDKDGREIAFKVWVKDADGLYKDVTIPRVGSKSGRVFMLHGFYPEYPGQGRGYSRLAHALQEFENLTDFTMAQIKKAINQSNIALYTKPSIDAPASNPMAEIMTRAGAGPAAKQYGANPEPATTAQGVTSESVQPVSFTPLPEAQTQAPGSVGVFSLNAGEDIKAFEPHAPSESFDKFVDAFTSYLAASMSMPVEVLLMRFNSNYSASRAALILFWRVANIWREEMAADFLDPVYTMWLSEEIASGHIIAPGWSDPVLRAAWANVNWIGSSMPNIDPEKSARADMLYSELGATTLDRIALDYSGTNGTKNRDKLKREYDDLPIPPWGTNAKVLLNQPAVETKE